MLKIEDVNDGSTFTFTDKYCATTSTQMYLGSRILGYLYQDDFNYTTAKLSVRFMSVGEDFVLFVVKTKTVDVAIKFRQEDFRELMLQWRG